jgi:hypothetical protein
MDDARCLLSHKRKRRDAQRIARDDRRRLRTGCGPSTRAERA